MAELAVVDAMKLLVVDDEPEIVEEMVEYLTEAGYSCLGATTVRAARRAFERDPDIGIVLTDVRMPDEEGIQLVERLVRTYQDQRVFEAIVFTGHGDEEVLVQAMRAGVRDYFPKPVDLPALNQSVDRLVESVRRRRRMLAAAHGVGSRLQDMTQSLSQVSTSLAEIRRQLGLPESASDGTGAADPAAEFAFGKLTKRQKDVLRHLATGQSNYQIAYELGITENTVKLYVSQILTASGFSNRTQLALAAARLLADPLRRDSLTG
ncbi:DNA-binding response regulator, LuxR family [Thioalkalivibrio nitratireducens DSM 14787]|uniref:DNA-binding response regulator, LuxR family n=1 Tax=Thioalkalivibrio nitratireducens (strain DSM 14787 / UNIQEM 213 / ALEN2) TaxID=1255043 RepID=L0DYK3_THIND|nr:response regulator transcription factor [Thioalkalivibrio nitratireducens]AGA34133.1 DNA-binding response regulator, LuxR family [Thioalkalivibrio nitratireducens DSM 14787]